MLRSNESLLSSECTINELMLSTYSPRCGLESGPGVWCGYATGPGVWCGYESGPGVWCTRTEMEGVGRSTM